MYLSDILPTVGAYIATSSCSLQLAVFYMLLSDLVSRRSVSFSPGVSDLWSGSLGALLVFELRRDTNGKRNKWTDCRNAFRERGCLRCHSGGSCFRRRRVRHVYGARSRPATFLLLGPDRALLLTMLALRRPVVLILPTLGSISSGGLSMITRSPVARHRLPSFLRMGIVSVVFLKSSRLPRARLRGIPNRYTRSSASTTRTSLSICYLGIMRSFVWLAISRSCFEGS